MRTSELRRCLPMLTILFSAWSATGSARGADEPKPAEGPADLILHNAKIATVDAKFSLAQAMAVRGERADLIVLDRDLLSCPTDDIKDTQVLSTYLDGKLVYERK